MQKNYLNFKDDEVEKPLYRIMPLDYLIKVFSTRKLTLAKPFKWDDPYENFILKHGKARTQDGKIIELKDIS